MRQQIGIRARLWLAAALPALLATALLLAVFLSRHGSELLDAWSDRGRAAARQLAGAAEFPLFAGNQESLQRLVEATMAGDAQMQGVGIFTVDGRMHAVAGSLSNVSGQFNGQEQLIQGKHLLVLTPIRQTALPFDDLFADFGNVRSSPEVGRVIGFAAVELKLDVLAKQQRDLLFWAVITSSIGLVLAGLLSTWIASSVTRPIALVSRQVARIRDGELEARVDLAQAGVLQNLAAGVNDMAARVAMTQEVLRDQVSQATDELRRQKEAAEQAARVDTLTGVATRRAFTECAEAEVQRALRYALPLSLIIIDLDHFKAINDTYGHVVGDSVLADFAQTVSKEIREVDMIARMGGEEFVVLLPNTDIDEALAVAERMRLAVANSELQAQGRRLVYTASFGVAEFVPTELSLISFLARSDAALYRAKRQGRNRVERA
ncbi:MAG TPA: diguanylate cyclase [Macromonas sp.]|nr:diguanylate cyclase [Macromonas sp.]